MIRPTRNRLLVPGLAVAVLFALSACDRRDDAAVQDADNPPPAATDPAPTDMPAGQDATSPDAANDPNAIDNAPGAAVTVESIDLGNEVGADNRVAAALRNFATSDTIHASVVTDGSGGTVSTRWTFEDGQVVHTEDKVVPAGEQVTDFMITNPSGWPTGEYQVEVSVDGRVVATRQYEVR